MPAGAIGRGCTFIRKGREGVLTDRVGEAEVRGKIGYMDKVCLGTDIGTSSCRVCYCKADRINAFLRIGMQGVQIRGMGSVPKIPVIGQRAAGAGIRELNGVSGEAEDRFIGREAGFYGRGDHHGVPLQGVIAAIAVRDGEADRGVLREEIDMIDLRLVAALLCGAIAEIPEIVRQGAVPRLGLAVKDDG